MKINEVEQIVDITKKNIRFYESEGLLTPERNRENGYREYSEADIDQLKKIKLLRKLAVPLDEIRQMQEGVMTVSDCMRRQIIMFEREKENAEQRKEMCACLLDSHAAVFSDLDAERFLEHVDQLEREGVNFMNVNRWDKKKEYAAPVAMTALALAFLFGIVGSVYWAYLYDDMPWGFLVFFGSIMVFIFIGLIVALMQRIKEIKGGEEHVARKY